jgi:N-acyl-D-aspartate/D-glutamate deacylase
MHDLVIRGGLVVDGTGAAPRIADVAVDGGLVTAVGRIPGKGVKEIDAQGLLVTPGWVDIHTHYDGQATWDAQLSPSCWHGVTTVVMGNCGVGFAPARPDRHDWLIALMEGVEDIPGAALAEGIKWNWETFPQYLDALEKTPRVLDVATQAPHGAIRAYVMGERGARNEAASSEDIRAMGVIVREALEAGALGFSTSRTLLHRAKDGEPVPGTFAGADELLGIGEAMAQAGHGVFEMASDMAPALDEFAWMKALAARTGRPVTYAMIQSPLEPENWRELLRLTEEARDQGAELVAQIACRPTGMVLGWQSTVHPFITRAAYQAIADLPFAERLEKLKNPMVRAAILGETPPPLPGIGAILTHGFNLMFRPERRTVSRRWPQRPAPRRTPSSTTCSWRRRGEAISICLS